MTGDVVLLPEGTYYIVSNYGEGNSVVRSDVHVDAAKLTDVVVTHRAAVITLKLVNNSGGEALANTQWTVLTPGGDVSRNRSARFRAWSWPKATIMSSPATKAAPFSATSRSSPESTAKSKCRRAERAAPSSQARECGKPPKNATARAAARAAIRTWQAAGKHLASTWQTPGLSEASAAN